MFDDLYVLRDRARSAAARGDLDGAIAALVSAAGQTHVTRHDYVAILRPLTDALVEAGDTRGALTVLSYLASIDATVWKRAEELMPDVPPVDRGFIRAAQGRMSQAATEMEGAGFVAAAAIYREKAKDWTGARTLWSRLGQVIDPDRDRYVTALVRFNLARCARQCGDARQAREAIIESVRMLEEAADHFESIGQRERAFDCFQVLVQIGRESGAFEDVLEGFVNSIRILREDHLKYEFALDLFEESIAAATQRGETRAAATLAHQAAEYATSLGLAAHVSEYSLREADLWRAVAEQQRSRGAPPDAVESALLPAIIAFGKVGQYARVGKLFAELGTLDLAPSRRAHYERASKRYEHVEDEPVSKSKAGPRSLGDETVSTDVWHVDVLECERRGSAAEACADVLLDKRWNDLIRRKALIARLTALQVEDRPDGTPDDAMGSVLESRVRLSEQLGHLQLYAVLSPLEKLFERPERRVKVAVLLALQTLCYKRSFIIVRAALRDPDPVLVDHAANTVKALYFPHAVDPLSRIMRESSHANVRAAAVSALARIDTLESAELVLGVLEHGTPADRIAALAAAKETGGKKFIELARAALPGASDALQATLREVLAAKTR
ncbi:MAG: HEAT repeat domain-containing protein [Myxococcota bacterium]|nr:HEAT repeat domain-containing protein [Myxococcota bacterium]